MVKRQTRKRVIVNMLMAIVASLILIVTTTTSAILAESAPTPAIPDPTGEAQIQAQAQLIAGAMKACVQKASSETPYMWDNDGTWHLFGATPKDWAHAVAVGPDATSTMGVNDDDGRIWCWEATDDKGNKLLTEFSDYIDTSIEEILCSSDGSPGAIIGLKYNPATKALSSANDPITAVINSIEVLADGVNITDTCSPSVRAYMYNRYGAEEHIKNIYENWRANNKYAVLSWDELGKEPIATGEDAIVSIYFLYKNEFDAACIADETTDKTAYKTVVYENGAWRYKYFNPVSAGRYDDTFQIFNGATYNCTTLAQKLSEKADAYYEAIMRMYGKACHDAYLNDYMPQWYKYRDNASHEYASETVASAEQAINKFTNLSADGDYSDFIETDPESGAVMCVEIGDVQIVFNESEAQSLKSQYDDDMCNNSGSKLGWILCPIISGLQEVLNELYENIIEPMLQINVSIFGTNTEVYGVWQIFQNMANVIFVIVFLFAIFSQITGFGIDNYGIKRLLPKLIIAAILVNLSFIICQALVDVSNIVGNGAKDLLMGIRVNGQPVSGADSALTTFTSGAAMTGFGVVAAATLTAWAPALLIPFLLGLLSVLIAIVFMFVLLGVRQAGVIILVIISPLALLMYMLPNTKSLFDKWKNLFQALLVLYPVCGLMIGGCALAGKVIISSADNFWMALLGGLLSVIPFFLIPKITKGAMSAMGKIGGMIAGLGGAASRGITGAVKGSDGYKAYQQRALDTQNRRKAGLDKNYQPTKIRGRVKNWYAGTALGKATGYDKMQQGRVATAMKAQERDKAMEKYTDQNFVQASNARISNEAREAGIKTYQENFRNSNAFMNEDFSDGGELEQEVNAVLDRGDEQEITSMVRTMGETSDHTRDVLRNALTKRTASGVSARDENAMRTVTRAIKDNGGKWKGSWDRRMFNWATKSSVGGNAGGNNSLSSYNYGLDDAALSEKVSPSYMNGADDDVINSMAKAVSDGRVTGKNLEAYQNAAYQALHGDNANDMKEERRRALETIAGNYIPDSVLQVRKQNADAQAEAKYANITDSQLEEIATNPKSSPTDAATAEAELKRRGES